MIVKFSITFLIPVTLVLTSIKAFRPPESVLTHPGLIEATDIPSPCKSIDKDLMT